MSDANEQISVMELAKYLNIHYADAIVLVRNGAIPAKKFGKQYFVTKYDAEDFKKKSENNKKEALVLSS
jgi:excisionase family DNA binding protein